ncbi:MAG TPA: protein phosphatase 2C domain-containing protein [Arthrobacter sp.]|nr:protein phosphatase 2C domain-containing protein [Arthrobacter sp.]
MAKILRFAARSDVGKVRSKNDDSAYAGHHLAVVADGMGGHAGGNVASASTVLEMIHLDEDGYDDDAGTALADEIQTANSLLSDLVRSSPALAGMGTTVTAMLLSGDKLHFAHIGDSRAYRLKDGVFEQISVDHTFVQRLIDEGRLRPEDAETHPHKNVLMRVLGDVDASPELDLATFDADVGERWMLCSDGLNAVVDARTIEQIVRAYPDLQECVDRLVELTLEGGSPDNVTVVVTDVVEKTPDDVATRALSVVDADSKSATGSSAVSRHHGEAADDISLDMEPENSDHLNAKVLRKELSSRQHVLVGSAATAAATGQIPKVAERTATRSAQRRAATLLTHKSPETAEEFEEEELERRPRRRRMLAAVLSAVVVLIIAAGLWAGYAWTQTRYYVGEYEGHVAIYRGISQDLGPISLSTLRSKTVVEVDELPQYAQQRLDRTLPAEDINEAFRIVRDLQFPYPHSSPPAPDESPAETASPTGEPTDTPSGRPTQEPTSPSPAGSEPEPTPTNQGGGGS